MEKEESKAFNPVLLPAGFWFTAVWNIAGALPCPYASGCLFADLQGWPGALARSGRSMYEGILLSRMCQTWPQETGVDRLTEDGPEPAQQLLQRPRAANHPRGRVGREREVNTAHLRKNTGVRMSHLNLTVNGWRRERNIQG